MKDLNCPYCDKGLDIDHDDGFGYQTDVLHEMGCEHCGKSFVFQTIISFRYEPAKADCLNDGNHDYKLTCTYPREFSRMRCSMCDDEREMTEAERLKYGIGTRESYFKSLNQ